MCKVISQLCYIRSLREVNNLCTVLNNPSRQTATSCHFGEPCLSERVAICDGDRYQLIHVEIAIIGKCVSIGVCQMKSISDVGSLGIVSNWSVRPSVKRRIIDALGSWSILEGFLHSLIVVDECGWGN